MDGHSKLAAALHAASAILALLVLLLLALMLGGFALLPDVPALAAGVLAGIGLTVIVVLAILCIAQLVAAICFLNGVRSARAWLLVFSVLELINVPFGTALGVYSLWAFLRTAPAPASVIVPGGAPSWRP